jgi:serine protease Do
MKGKMLIFALALCFMVVPGALALLGQTEPSPQAAVLSATGNGDALALYSPADQSSRDSVIRLQEMLNDRNGAWLGVDLTDVTQAKVNELKLPGDYGAIVSKVDPGSPAAQAGLKQNDVILAFGGMQVWSVAQLSQRIRETPPGRTVELTVSRDGRRMHLSVKMAAPKTSVMFPGGNFIMPEVRVPPVSIPGRYFDFNFFPGTTTRLGIEAQELTPQLAGYFKVKQGKGILVAEVEDGSPAARAGLKAGDCIVKADATEVDSVSSLRRALAPAAGHEVTLTIVRDGREQSVQVDLEPAWKPNPQQEAENSTPATEQLVRELESQIRQTEREERRVEAQLQRLSSRVDRQPPAASSTMP